MGERENSLRQTRKQDKQISPWVITLSPADSNPSPTGARASRPVRVPGRPATIPRLRTVGTNVHTLTVHAVLRKTAAYRYNLPCVQCWQQNSSMPLQFAMHTELATTAAYRYNLPCIQCWQQNSSIPLQSAMHTVLATTAAYRYNLPCIQCWQQQQHAVTNCHAYSAGNNSSIPLQSAMHSVGNNSSMPLQSVMHTVLATTAAYRYNLSCIQCWQQQQHTATISSCIQCWQEQQHTATICHAHSAVNDCSVSLQPAMHVLGCW